VELKLGHIKRFAQSSLNCRAKAREGGDEDEDLLEEKKSYLEHVFLCMDTLTAEKAFANDWRIK